MTVRASGVPSDPKMIPEVRDFLDDLWRRSRGDRQPLTTATTYTIGATGDFLTLQAGWDNLAGSIDTRGNAVTFQLQDLVGTYAGLLATSTWVGGGVVTIQGNASTPANTHISVSTASTDAIRLLRSTLPAKLVIQNLKITTSGSARDCIRNEGVGFIEFGNINFNPAQFAVSAVSPGAQIAASGVGNTLSASSCFGLAYAQSTGVVFLRSTAYNFSTTTAFAAACAFAEGAGKIFAQAATFTGSASSATGQRYFARELSLIDAKGGGANFFPGNSAGATQTGSQYT